MADRRLLNGISRWLSERPLVTDTLTTTILNSVGKGVGLLVPFFVAAWFGVRADTDAFFFTYSLILLLVGIVSSSAESAIIPFIAECKAKGEDIGRFVGTVLTLFVLAVAVLLALLVLGLKPLLTVITRFPPDGIALIYRIFLEISVLIFFVLLSCLFSGILYAHHRFVLTSVSPLFRGVTVLAAIFLFRRFLGVHALVIGYVAGELLRCGILALAVHRLGELHWSFSLRFTPEIRQFLSNTVFQTIAVGAINLNIMVDKVMASWLGQGKVSILYYAEKLYTIPVTFVLGGMFVTMLAHWSDRHYAASESNLRRDVLQAAWVLATVTSLMVVALLIFRRPVVALSFLRGNFSGAYVQETATVFACYLLGFVPLVIGGVFARGLLVLKNSRSVMHCMLIMIALNGGLNLLLMKFWGLPGIALATSFSSCFSCCYMATAFFRSFQKSNSHTRSGSSSLGVLP